MAQQMLLYYRNLDSGQAKAVALLRNQFGKHPIHWQDGKVTTSADPASESASQGPTAGD